ncbi:MAG: hypothetical protein RJA07_1085 [Bacteroidota bacterium]|jgi:uncharacterized membrane protein
MNKNRLEAFSDGVLAIIITIMVLELKVPTGHTFKDLLPLLPVFLSYVLSFVYVGIYWGNHHHLLHVVKKISSGIIWSNLNLLFWLSLIPFATAWMGENNFSGESVAVYAVLLNVCGLSYYVLQRIIMSCHTLSPKMQIAMQKQSRKGIISLVAYSTAIVVSFFLPIISEIIFVAVAIMWLVPDKNIEHAISE